MAERFNCIQNQVTTHDRVLIRDKVAGFVVVGGQDNVQAVTGQMLGFFAELGFVFPQFPYVAHSRGWTAEDMERNVAILRTSREARRGSPTTGGAGGRTRDAPPRGRAATRPRRERRTQSATTEDDWNGPPPAFRLVPRHAVRLRLSPVGLVCLVGPGTGA